MQVDRTEIERAVHCGYVGQTVAVEGRAGREVLMGVKEGWSILGKYITIFLDTHLPMSLKGSCLQPVCLAGNDIRIPSMASYKSIGKEA